MHTLRYISSVVLLLLCAIPSAEGKLPNGVLSAIELLDAMSEGGNTYEWGVGYSNQPLALGNGSDVTVIYVNGIMTDTEGFEWASISINRLLRDRFPYASFGGGFYNISAQERLDDISSLLCPAYQLGYDGFLSDTFVDLCEGSFSLTEFGSDIAEAALQVVRHKVGLTPAERASIEHLSNTIRLSVQAGRKVIIVAHSQGNIFVMDALEHLKSGSYGTRYMKSIGVLMLGSPIRQSSIPQGYTTKLIRSCNDLVTILGKGDDGAPIEGLDVQTFYSDVQTSSVSYFIKTPTLTPSTHIASEGCYRLPGENYPRDVTLQDLMKAHSLTQGYLGSGYAEKVAEALSEINSLVEKPSAIIQPNDHIITIDRLNVRSDTVVSGDTFIRTEDVGSKGVVSNESRVFANGYYWYNVCFSSGCGYVASDWIDFDPAFPIVEYEAVSTPVDTGLMQHLELATDGSFFVKQFDELGNPYEDIPFESNDRQGGLGGCTDCATAPGNFEITSQEVTCYRGAPRVNIRWNSARGTRKYHVFRDGGEFQAERIYRTYTDRNGLVPGEAFTYTLQAIGYRGATRNADNAWRVEIPWTICGGSEPPPPYDGPVPSGVALEPSEIEPNYARVEAEITRNDVFVTQVDIEYGQSESFGNVETAPSIANMDDVETTNDTFPISCDETYFYRFAIHHDNGVVYSNAQSFDSPSCSSNAPYQHALTHDVTDNTIVVSWDEETLSTSTVVLPELRIEADPRPGVTIGEWEERPAQSSGIEAWKDEWLDPQPGGKYCYRVRTFNTAYGSNGYSPRSNERCMTVEGVFVPQVEFPEYFVRVDLNNGLWIDGTGGEGEFTVLRNVNGGSFEEVASLDSSSGINWTDSDVEFGNTYCYVFVQSGVESEQVCKTYFSVNDVGVPTMLQLYRNDAETVRAVFSSSIPEEGYFMVWYDHPQYGWIDSGGSAFYTDSDVIEKTVYLTGDGPACVKVEQWINGTASGFSNTLCLESGTDTQTYVPPQPPNAPLDLLVNNLSDPTGIPDVPIRFSAVFDDVEEGDSASTFQIQVSPSPSDWSNLYWDSGMHNTSVSIGERATLTYGGGPLPSGQPLYWRARFTDAGGAVGAWSELQRFFTLAPHDPTLVGMWHMNGEVGSLDKTSNEVGSSSTDIIEYGGTSYPGFDGASAGAYALRNGPLLELGNVLTPNQGDFSISFWVKTDYIHTYGMEVISAYTPGTSRGFSIEIYKEQLNVSRLIAKLYDPSGQHISVIGNTNMAGSGWRKIDVVFYNDNKGRVKLYIDGSPSARSGPWPSDNPYNLNQPLHWIVGAQMEGNQSGYYERFDGFIDDLRVYNRARTASEIYDDHQHERQ